MSEEIKNEIEETEAIEAAEEKEAADEIEAIEEAEAEEEIEEVREKAQKNSLFKRVVAWIFLALIAVMFCIFIFMVITGSKYIIPMLFVLIILPFAAYIMIWLRDVFSK